MSALHQPALSDLRAFPARGVEGWEIGRRPCPTAKTSGKFRKALYTLLRAEVNLLIVTARTETP
ncbi:unnamed protein product, partial [Nesidiocoris tenuis]